MLLALRHQFHALGVEGRAKYNEAAQQLLDPNAEKKGAEEGVKPVTDGEAGDEEMNDDDEGEGHESKKKQKLIFGDAVRIQTPMLTPLHPFNSALRSTGRHVHLLSLLLVIFVPFRCLFVVFVRVVRLSCGFESVWNVLQSEAIGISGRASRPQKRCVIHTQPAISHAHSFASYVCDCSLTSTPSVTALRLLLFVCRTGAQRSTSPVEEFGCR